MNGFEISFLGHVMTFDMVTFSGLICGLIFASGFRYALRNEARLRAADKNC